jgi:hypothetical protein
VQSSELLCWQISPQPCSFCVCCRYTTGQHFLAHEDGFPPLLANANGFQRHATLLLYLNDVQQVRLVHNNNSSDCNAPHIYIPCRIGGIPLSNRPAVVRLCLHYSISSRGTIWQVVTAEMCSQAKLWL